MLILKGMKIYCLFMLWGKVLSNSLQLEEADPRPVICRQNRPHRALGLSLLSPIRAGFYLSGVVVTALPLSHAECSFAWILSWLQCCRAK